jgi:hypothetical protein
MIYFSGLLINIITIPIFLDLDMEDDPDEIYWYIFLSIVSWITVLPILLFQYVRLVNAMKKYFSKKY